MNLPSVRKDHETTTPGGLIRRPSAHKGAGLRLIGFRMPVSCFCVGLILISVYGCKKDKPNLEYTFCNGGMVPDTVTFMESNLDGSAYLWQLFDANGTALSSPTSTGAVNSIFARIDSAGSYKVKVDVDNESSGEINFTLRNIVTEGTQRAVSFFDNNFTLWSVYPDSDCRAAIRVKQVNGIGGIDYYREANKIYYVAGNDLIFCFPNGEELVTVTGQGFSDICIVQSNGRVFISTFGTVIHQTTVANIVNAVENQNYDATFPIGESIDQLTYDPQGNDFYFTNSSTSIYRTEAITSVVVEPEDYGSDLAKTALVYDVLNRRLYFAEGNSPCFIKAVNPDQPNQILLTVQVPCDGSIRGMDMDEQEQDIVYSDGKNVWMFNLAFPTAQIALVTDVDKTMQKDVLNFSTSIQPPIGDVVIARYQD